MSPDVCILLGKIELALGDDRIKISIAFKNSSAGDKAWIEHQEKKEMNGEQKKKA